MSNQVPIQPMAWNSVAGRRQTGGPLKPLVTQQHQEREVIIISSDTDEEDDEKPKLANKQMRNTTQPAHTQPLVSQSVVTQQPMQAATFPIIHSDPNLVQPTATNGGGARSLTSTTRRSAQLRRQEQAVRMQQQQQQQGSEAAASFGSNGSAGSRGSNSAGSPNTTAGSGGVSSSFASSFHPPMPLQEFTATLLTAQTRGTFTERFVQAHLSHLAPEVYERVAACYTNRRSLDEFLAQVQLIPVQAVSTRSLGLDLSLAEFQQLVMDDFVVRSSNPDELIEQEMNNLGPETRSLVEEAWVTRLSTQGFCRELSLLTRDGAATNREKPGEQFTLAHLAIVTQSLLTAESKLRTYVPLTAVQRVVSLKMRTILVDWLVDVSERFKCGSETVHLAAALVDRYLSLTPVLKSELQLLGVSAMFLAAKYEMVYPPEMRDYIYISACTYTKDDIIRMERQLFVALEYNVTIPTTNTLAHCILQQQDPRPSEKQVEIACFLVDILMAGLPYNSTAPHIIAATAVYLSRIADGVPTMFLPNIRSRVPGEMRHFLPIAWAAFTECGLITSSGGSAGTGLKYAAIKGKYAGPNRHFVSGDTYPCQDWVMLIRAVKVDLEVEQRDMERIQQQATATGVQSGGAEDEYPHPPTPL